jgi:hypothetical protein
MGLVALCLALFLSVLADNSIGAKGAGMLAEPLGKLTALLKLNLSCTFFMFSFYICVCCWLGWGLLHCVWLCF